MTEIAVTEPALKGWIAGGRIDEPVMGGGCGRPLAVFSVHAPTPGPYDKNVNKILDYLIEVSVGCDLVVGGDFNVTTAVRHQREALENTPAERRIIERMRTEFGLINAWQVLHPNQDLPQTLRWTGNRAAPYHCDGLFIPLAWVRHLEFCEVIVGDEWSILSDHNPIVASFRG
jgi:endonuclease/exonuclease/phosphatase family metal-dependent hydrolase